MCRLPMVNRNTATHADQPGLGFTVMLTATAGLPAVCGRLPREAAGTRWSRSSQQYVLFRVLRRKCSAVRQMVESLLLNARFECRRRRAHHQKRTVKCRILGMSSFA